MTVIANEQRNQYSATLGQTVFSYTFEVADATDLKVYKRSSTATPNDTNDILIYTTDYTVTGVGSNTGGTIVLNTSAAAGDVVTIEGGVPVQRSSSFTPGGLIRAEDLNTEFDNQTLIAQKQQTQIDETIPKYPQSATIGSQDLILPILPANYIWRMNVTDTAIEAIPFTDSDRASVLRADLASHDAGKGASMVGLENTGTVQDLAEAPFIVQTSNAATPNAQVMGSLTTGLVKNTTGSGVQSIAVEGTDYWKPEGTPVDVTSGGTGATTAANARANLGIGDSGTHPNGYYLQTANNLSDLADVPTARTNLGLGTAAVQNVTYFNQVANNLSDVANKTTAFNNVSPTTTKGDLIVNNGSNNVRLPVGSDSQILIADSTASFGVRWINSGGTIPFTTKGDLLTYNGLTNIRLGVGTDNYALVADSGTSSGLNYKAVLLLSGGTMSGAIDMGGFNVTNAADPVLGSDLVTKSYLDNVISNTQLACELASTADLAGWTYNNGTSGVGATLTAPSTGTFAIDGVTPATNTRILIKDMSNPAYNGVYVVTTNTVGSAGVLTRATDYDQASEMQAGDIFAVVAGSSQAATQWMMSQTAAITIGTTALTFQQMSSTGALLKANNLSDIPSPSTARTNLGLGSAAVQADTYFLQSGNNLSDLPSATTARGNLGLGTIATHAANEYAAVANNLSDLTSASTARSNLGLGTAATQNSTAFLQTANNLSDVPTPATARSNLGLAIGTNVQAYSANLTNVASPTANAVLVADNSGVAHWTASLTNGQIIIGSTGSQPVPATLTAGTGVTITNGTGTITIAATGTGNTNYSDLFLLMGG